MGTLTEPDSGRAAKSDYRFVIRLTALSMLVSTLVMTHANTNYFPRTYDAYSVFTFLKDFPYGYELYVYYVFLTATLWLVIKPNSRLVCTGLLLYIWVMVLQDLMRFRHTMYMQSFTLLTLVAFWRTPEKERLTALKIMLCGVYFWAGFHKLNITFYEQVFPNFVSDFYDYRNPPSSFIVRLVANLMLYSVPVIEAGIGIALLFPKMRKIGSFFAFIMLCVVLSCIHTPHTDFNSAAGIWIWNIWLFAMEWRLFMYGNNLASPFFLFSRTVVSRLSMVLFVLLPMMSIWCTSLYMAGFKMYTGTRMEAKLSFPPEETFAMMPPHLQTFLLQNHEMTLVQWQELEGNRYAMGYTPFLIKNGLKTLCRMLDNPEKAKLILQYAPPFYSRIRPEETVDMCPATVKPKDRR